MKIYNEKIKFMHIDFLETIYVIDWYYTYEDIMYIGIRNNGISQIMRIIKNV